MHTQAAQRILAHQDHLDLVQTDLECVETLLQCFSQMATLSGTIFADDAAHTNHAQELLVILPHLLESPLHNSQPLKHKLEDAYLRGFSLLATLVSKIVLHFPNHPLPLLHHSMAHFVQIFGVFTFYMLHMMEILVQAQDDTWENVDEGIGGLLSSWVFILNRWWIVDAVRVEMAASAQTLFTNYVQTRLNVASFLAQVDREEEEDHHQEISDWKQYRDHLISLALLARISPSTTLAFLHQHWTDIKDRFVAFQKQASANQEDLLSLWERTHWHLIIAGYVLADSAKGEVPEVPDSFLKEEVHPRVISITHTILEVIAIHQDLLKAGARAHLSPLLATTMAWFLKRWCSTYLMRKNAKNALLHQYSGERSGGTILHFILNQITFNVAAWSGEAQVQSAWVSLLYALCSVMDSVVPSALPHMLMSMTPSTSQLDPYLLFPNPVSLPPRVLRTLMQALLSLGNYFSQHVPYLERVISPITQTLVATIGAPNFKTNYRHSDVLLKFQVVLEAFRGICRSILSNEDGIAYVLSQCRQHFDTWTHLVEVYKDEPHLLRHISKYYTDFADNFLDQLDNWEDRNAALHAFLLFFRQIHQHSLSRMSFASVKDEVLDTQVGVLKGVLKAVIAVASSTTGVPSQDLGIQDHILIEALPQVARVIVPEVLQFPDVTELYYSFLTLFFDASVKRLGFLSPAVLKHIITTMELGANHYESGTARKSLEAVASLANIHCRCVRMGVDTPMLQTAGGSEPILIQYLLFFVLNFLLFGHFSAEVIDAGADSLFYCIAADQEAFKAMANVFISTREEYLRDHLSRCFSDLMNKNNLQVTLEKHNLLLFRSNMYSFLSQVKNLTMIK
eukprot:TRINITY_DN3517_c0_g3_i7.p1 TRINITY_DN3517_c0_g3~~TRINITY_DN3517_c0_g3_i7.p1  ORF type:complete len:850 (-),score=186.32 TRINITY_DN3517_c0_g3_i7:320-2869(-)